MAQDKTIVIALGGNALAQPGEEGTITQQFRHTRETQDPIYHLREKLGVADHEFEELDAEVNEIVEASVEFAKNGTDPKPEDALKNVYA